MTIDVRSADNVYWVHDYANLVDRVMLSGIERNSRGGLVLDVSPFSYAIKPPYWQKLGNRGGSREFALVEQLSYVAGWDSDILEQYAPSYGRFREDAGHYHGAYGPRLYQQLSHLIEVLWSNPHSRRAVMSLWYTWDLQLARDNVSVPCTCTLQFYLNYDVLDLHVMMRSCDVWYGAYYDLPAFGMLHRLVARLLGWTPGTLHFTTTSLHIYRPFWQKSRDLILQPDGPPLDALNGAPYDEGLSAVVAWADRQLKQYDGRSESGPSTQVADDWAQVKLNDDEP